MEKQVSVGFVGAYSVWCVAVGMWVVGWIIDEIHLEIGSVIIAVVAAIMTSQQLARRRYIELRNAMTVIGGAQPPAPTPLDTRR
jgi:hypothetical protein